MSGGRSSVQSAETSLVHADDKKGEYRYLWITPVMSEIVHARSDDAGQGIMRRVATNRFMRLTTLRGARLPSPERTNSPT